MQSLDILKLFLMKAQMSARKRSLDHHSIRKPVIFFPPVAQNDLHRLDAGYDRRQLRLSRARQLGQIHGEPCTGYDQIDPRCYSRLDILLIFSGRHHNVDSENTIFCNLSGLLYLRSDRPQIRADGILVKIRFPVSDLCRREHTDSAFCRHCSGQRRKAHTDSHAALYNRHFRYQIPNFKGFCFFHFTLPR